MCQQACLAMTVDPSISALAMMSCVLRWGRDCMAFSPKKLTWSILMPRKNPHNHAPTSIGVWRFWGLQDTIFRNHWCGVTDLESVSKQFLQARWWHGRGVADGGARLGAGRLFGPLCNFADFNSCTSLRTSDASLRINSPMCYPFKGGFSKYATLDLTQIP